MSTKSASRPARERLLAAAAELFYEEGIAATGVDAVLARAGVSPSTLYAHFPGKDALVAAYLEERHRRWVATWDEVLGELTDPVDRLLSVFDALALHRTREGNRRGCAFLAAATELPAGHPAQAWLEADSRLLTDRLRELLDAAPELVEHLSDDGFTPLHLACFSGGPEAVRLLVERGASLERVAAASFARVRPLGTAAFARQLEAARVLLEAGADPNGAGAGGVVPLETAEANADEELVRLLLEHGATA